MDAAVATAMALADRQPFSPDGRFRRANLDEVGVSAEELFAENSRALLKSRRPPVVPIWGVEPPEPYNSAVAEFDIEMLIDPDGVNAPAAHPAAAAGLAPAPTSRVIQLKRCTKPKVIQKTIQQIL